MKAKVMVAGGVVVALLLLLVLLLATHRRPPQNITLRHVTSFRTGNVTTMSFEVKNHTSDAYIFAPFKVQVRTGNSWTNFPGVNITPIHPPPKLDPASLASYTLSVTNLPAETVVRFSIRCQKVLLGVSGFFRRAELKVKSRARGTAGAGISLNPYDKNSQVYGLPTEVVSEGIVEREEGGQ